MLTIWNDSTSRPPTDITETDTTIDLSVDLPGVDDKDISVTAEGNMVTVSALRREPKTSNRFLTERTYGRLVRSFRLSPAVDAGSAVARLERGVLTLTFERRAESRARTIPVTTA